MNMRLTYIPIINDHFFGIGFTIIGIGFPFQYIWQSNEYYLLHCCGGILLIIFGAFILAVVWFSQQKTRRSI